MLRNFIEDLTKEESAKIESLMSAKTAVPGTVLIEQGSEDRNLFFIITGEFEVYQKLKIAAAYHVVKLASLKGPNILGEANLLSDNERNASILIKTECKYLELSYENFEKLKDSDPAIALKLVTFAGAIASQRYSTLHSNLQTKMFSEAEDLQKGILWMKKYIGDVQKCSPEIAKKLFKL